MTKVSRAGNPSSLRFFSTVRALQVRIGGVRRWWNELTCCSTTQGFFADHYRLDVLVHRRWSVYVIERYNVVLQAGLEQSKERPHAINPVC